MRLLLRLLAAGFVSLAFCTGSARADSPSQPPSPLRLIPAEADLLLEIKDPPRLAGLLRNLDLLKQIQKFALVQEQLDSTQARRARQLLAYVEKSLGERWPDLIDRLAGGGVALGVKFAPAKASFLLVVQGKDETLMERFLKLALTVIEDELARQESKDKITKGSYHGITGYQIGNDLRLARAGAALVISNHKDALARALNLYLGKEKKSLSTHPSVAEAAKLLPESPLVNVWLNMAPIHKSQAGKELYKSPRDNFALTVLFGEYLDVAGRSPFLCAGLQAKKDGFLFTIRAPRGRDGMGPERDLHLAAPGKPGCRPLLEPKGVMYSSSFYFDFSRIWQDRAKLFPKAQVDALMQADKGAANVLAAGFKISGLLEAAGAYHRLVVVDQPKVGYQKKPKQAIPAFAIITEMRKPDKFARAMDAILRAGGLLITNQIPVKLEEETRAGYEIVGYRFDEKAEFKQDVNDIRFNFSPCYVRVDNQFVFCSTIELCRELVDLLVTEKKQQPGKSGAARVQDRFYSKGLANLLGALEDQLMVQLILGQAVPPGEAKEQVQAFIKLVRDLGTLTTSGRIGEKDTRYDFRMRIGK
jgi:hypothetical protein